MPFCNSFATVDGTDCPIQEPQVFEPKWYSHKINRAGVRYEIGVSVRSKKIVWVYGPFACGSNPDLLIFRSKMKGSMKPGETVIADSGYKDEKCVTPDGVNSRIGKLHSTLRARHERLNQCFKMYKVLSIRFRHDLRLHGYCFRAIANVVQLTLHEHPLFAIDQVDK